MEKLQCVLFSTNLPMQYPLLIVETDIQTRLTLDNICTFFNIPSLLCSSHAVGLLTMASLRIGSILAGATREDPDGSKFASECKLLQPHIKVIILIDTKLADPHAKNVDVYLRKNFSFEEIFIALELSYPDSSKDV